MVSSLPEPMPSTQTVSESMVRTKMAKRSTSQFLHSCQMARIVLGTIRCEAAVAFTMVLVPKTRASGRCRVMTRRSASARVIPTLQRYSIAEIQFGSVAIRHTEYPPHQPHPPPATPATPTTPATPATPSTPATPH